MLRVVLNAWVTKTSAAEILANPATRRRQVTMTISLNPLRSARLRSRSRQCGCRTLRPARSSLFARSSDPALEAAASALAGASARLRLDAMQACRRSREMWSHVTARAAADGKCGHTSFFWCVVAFRLAAIGGACMSLSG